MAGREGKPGQYTHFAGASSIPHRFDRAKWCTVPGLLAVHRAAEDHRAGRPDGRWVVLGGDEDLEISQWRHRLELPF